MHKGAASRGDEIKDNFKLEEAKARKLDLATQVLLAVTVGDYVNPLLAEGKEKSYPAKIMLVETDNIFYLPASVTSS